MTFLFNYRGLRFNKILGVKLHFKTEMVLLLPIKMIAITKSVFSEPNKKFVKSKLLADISLIIQSMMKDVF